MNLFSIIRKNTFTWNASCMPQKFCNNVNEQPISLYIVIVYEPKKNLRLQFVLVTMSRTKTREKRRVGFLISYSILLGYMHAVSLDMKENLLLY